MDPANLPSCMRFKKAILSIVAGSFIFTNIAFAEIPMTSALDTKKETRITTGPESAKGGMLAPPLFTSLLNRPVRRLAEERADDDNRAWADYIIERWLDRVREKADARGIPLTAAAALRLFMSDVDSSIEKHIAARGKLSYRVSEREIGTLNRNAAAVKALAPAIIKRLFDAQASREVTVATASKDTKPFTLDAAGRPVPLVGITDQGIHDDLDTRIEKNYFRQGLVENLINMGGLAGPTSKILKSFFMVSSLREAYQDLLLGTNERIEKGAEHQPRIHILRTSGKPIYTLGDGTAIWGHASDNGIFVADLHDDAATASLITIELLRFLNVKPEVVKDVYEYLAAYEERGPAEGPGSFIVDLAKEARRNLKSKGAKRPAHLLRDAKERQVAAATNGSTNSGIVRIVNAISNKRVYPYSTTKGAVGEATVSLAGAHSTGFAPMALDKLIIFVRRAVRANNKNIVSPVSTDSVLSYIERNNVWEGPVSFIEDESDYEQAYVEILALAGRFSTVGEAVGYLNTPGEGIDRESDTRQIILAALNEFTNDVAMSNVADIVKIQRTLDTASLGVSVGVSLGGTKIGAAAVNLNADLLAKVPEVSTPKESAEALFEALWSQIERVIERVGEEKVVKIGVASPGPLDPETGIIGNTENIPLSGFPLKSRLEKRFLERYSRHVPVIVGHDASMGALGEAGARGTMPNTGDITFVTWGTGIGNGVIREGKSYVGDKIMGNMVSEIGHMVIRSPDGRYVYRASAEIPGLKEGEEYFESRMAGPTLIKRMRRQISKDVDGAQLLRQADKKDVTELELTDINRLAGKGNMIARRLIKTAAREFGMGIAAYVRYWQVRKEGFADNIVIGGGVAGLGNKMPSFIKDIRNGLIEGMRKDAARIKIALSGLGYEREILAFAPTEEERAPIIAPPADPGARVPSSIYAEFPVSETVDGMVDAAIAKTGKTLLPEVVRRMKVELTALETTINAIVLSDIGRKPVIIAHDTALNPEMEDDARLVAQATEEYLEEHYDGKLIIARGEGQRLAERIEEAKRRLNDKDTFVVTIAGDATLEAIKGYAAWIAHASLNDVAGTVLNVRLDPNEHYVPFVMLYDLAFKIAYGQIEGENGVNLTLLNAFLNYVADDDQVQPLTADNLKQGIIRVIPRAGRVSPEDARNAHLAQSLAMRSL
ncbi:MAG: ROK family protein [Candidatus Omnitrophica bacterium]|nr:ROK family protein [Candidatus Omnitrophota bacterium]